MNGSMRSVDMLSREEMAECVDAYRQGWEVSRLAARYGVLASDLRSALDKVPAPERQSPVAMRPPGQQAEGQGEQPRQRVTVSVTPYTLGHLNVELFGELERLAKVDVTDLQALNAEVQRSQAIEGVAKAIVANASTILDAQRAAASFDTVAFSMPKMLEG